MEKKIKAVDMVRKIRDDLYVKTHNMTHKELIDFYHAKSIKFRKETKSKLQTARK